MISFPEAPTADQNTDSQTKGADVQDKTAAVDGDKK